MSGVRVKDAWKPTDADKVKPYHNAWTDPHSPEGNFLVSDTHTGAGGLAPHLANTPNEQKYLAAKGIHAFHDHIARQVINQRGLTSVNRNQSAQWSQEKYEQGHDADVKNLSRSPHIGHQFDSVQQPDDTFEEEVRRRGDLGRQITGDNRPAGEVVTPSTTGGIDMVEHPRKLKAEQRGMF
jgi:hypothetical protein